jgi:hypothetical protein
MKQSNPWQFHAPTEAQQCAMERLRAAFAELAALIESETPASRPRSVALTHLEEAAMWANKAACQRDD